MIRFGRIELRTTDVAAARAFYRALLGEHGLPIVPLPEAAAARGAPAHWLGHLGVDDLERAASAFVARGAVRLGPTRETGGGAIAILRDPEGAVLALASPPEPGPTPIVWHQLHATDLARATASYCDLFGWHLTERLELGAHGVHQCFAWQEGGPSVGSIAETARLPGVHPHWLFHFRVPTLDPASVRSAGGTILDPVVLPSQDAIAACEDPQRAAFALRTTA